MKVKTGIDVVQVSRLAALSESALEKLFHPSELNDRRPDHLAGIFAAKEACFKALSLDSPRWLDVQVGREKNGKPTLLISNSLLPSGMQSLDVSISHDAGVAIAMVIIVLS